MQAEVAGQLQLGQEATGGDLGCAGRWASQALSLEVLSWPGGTTACALPPGALEVLCDTVHMLAMHGSS